MSVTFTGVGVEPMPISHVGMYSDNTPMVKTPDFMDIVNKADTMILRDGSLQGFVTAMFLYDSLYRSGCAQMRLVLPYIPGARQDRINVEGDVLNTLRSVATMLNQRGFREVVVADPHSPVAEQVIKDIKVYPLERIYSHLWKGYTGVIAPDKGAKARAEAAGKTLGLPVFYGGKTRDVSTGRLTGFEVEELPKGGHFIVVDDICDGGGTFIGLGEKIREQGCYADLFVTHGIFSKGTRAMKEIFKNIYTTDTRQINTDRRTQVMKFNIVDDMVNYN